MSGFHKLGYGVSPEQQSLLHQRNFSLRPLGTAGHLSVWRVLLLAWQPIAAFVLTVLILTAPGLRHGSLGSVVYAAVVVVLLAYPAIALAVLASGIAATRLHSKVRWPAVLYWLWWPASTLALSCLAVVLATALGEHLWQRHFLPYAEVERLQAYAHVDPATAGGVRLQDAGLVLFNSSATVDRLNTGCHKSGTVYCVAPVRRAGAAGAAAHHDLFMAGTDCCACPGEFRCGDWNEPAALGGIRVIDAHENELYRLAAQDWSAAHGLRVERPVFFSWVADPLATHQGLRTKGHRVLTMGLLVGPCLILALAAALNGILALLVDAGWAAPLEPPQRPGASSWPTKTTHYGEAEEAEGSEAGAPLSDPKYVCL